MQILHQPRDGREAVSTGPSAQVQQTEVFTEKGIRKQLKKTYSVGRIYW